MANENYYFSLKPILSYNADVITITALRGCGKSFASKVLCLNDALKDLTFCWIRRTDEQLQRVKETFLNDIKKVYPTKYNNFRIVGNYCEYVETQQREITRKDGSIEIIDEVIDVKKVGYFISLNVSFNAKGLSIVNIGNVIFDEFIEEDNNNYLKNEIIKFNSVLNTIMRLSSPRLILLSNSLSVNNPYFRYFNINLPKNESGIIAQNLKTPNGVLRVASQFGFDSPKYKEKAKASLIGRISSLGEYGASALDDKFILDDNSKVIKRADIGIINFQYNIYFENVSIGVYVKKNGIVYFSKPQKNAKTFVLNDIKKASESDNNFIINKKHVIITSLLNNYANGYLAFENSFLASKFIDIANYCMTK